MKKQASDENDPFDESRKSYIVLCDALSLPDNSRIELFGDYVLMKPSDNQIDHIKRFLEANNNDFGFEFNKYEAVPTKSKHHGGIEFKPIDKANWKYSVIEHSSSNMSENAKLALALSDVNLNVLFEGASDKNGKERSTRVNALITATYFYDTYVLTDYVVKTLYNENVDQIRSIFESLEKFENAKTNYSHIEKALEDYLRIREVSIQSPFRILTYISILEHLLVTFQAKGGNEGSIKYQLQKKIKLINNQSQHKLDYEQHFKGPETLSLELIVEKIYEYRNAIAHGNKSDFSDKLQILKGRRTVYHFLEEVVRKILIFAVENPQLLKDLKEC